MSEKEIKEKPKKKIKLNTIIEIIVVTLFFIFLAGIILVQFISPESALGKWAINNVWDVKNTFTSFNKHLPSLVNGIILIIIINYLAKLLRSIFKRRSVKNNRNKTIYALFDGFIKYGSAIAIIIVALNAIGVDTTALIASVGVLTLVVGLGAQPLIADIISGIFIIFENEYNVGEIVCINDFRGTVLEIGIRSTKLVDAAGNIKIINNNNVGDVINLSRRPSLAVVDCDFPYDVPIEIIENIIEKNLSKMGKEVPDIIEGPYYKGVSEYKDSNVTIKLVATCDEENRYQVERDMLRYYRKLLVENDIDIAYPHVVVDYLTKKENQTATTKEKAKAKKFVDEQRDKSQALEEQTTVE